MYEKVSTDMDFAGREKQIAAFWKKNRIVEKSFAFRSGAPRFTFYDGPPTANGKPHIGHVLTRAVKDLIPRYQTMKGKNVLRIAGWDTHGLPVELEVERNLGLNGKEEIERFGIEPFIRACKESVWKYLSEWEEMSERVAFWLDMEHPYVTYHDSYIESVWWSLKQIADKGLLYRGHKVVPYCPRCGTALSTHEVAMGYREVTEDAAFVRFRIRGTDSAESLLAWTTTPWTLPSNVALCVNAEEEYCRLRFRDEILILAKALITSVFSEDMLREVTILECFPGSRLDGVAYEPLYAFTPTEEKAWYVVNDSYVTLTDGTGVVHIAPAFGEDDARIGLQRGLPFVQLVDTQGHFVEGTPWSGRFVKEADPLILADLKDRGLLFDRQPYTHNYPHCWRCATPLLYYARGTWFIRMTAVKDSLVENNRSVQWHPEHIRDGRMGHFVENVLDWGLSRERYWGTPLPVWTCSKGHVHVIGSRRELEEMSVEPLRLPELHRPYIDSVVLRCPECSDEMRRVSEVIDCWYDSGSMPFAQWHYPFENQESFLETFPADFISEAVDQTRGWFYTLLAIGTLVFGRSPFRHCLVLGHVQDKDGHKMSKHLGNVVDPREALDEQGADAVRWYFYTAGAPWLPSRFSAEAVGEVQRRFLGTLWNTYAFYILYAEIDGFDPNLHPLSQAALTLMDRWILSRLHMLVGQVDEGLSNYRIPESAAAVQAFVDELSNWYVRRSRPRFWGKGMDGDKESAFVTLYTALDTLCRLIAPFVPFISEAMYQNLVRSVDKSAPESVHLCDFPSSDPLWIDPTLEAQMRSLLDVVQLGRACRNLASIKNRQPCARLFVSGAVLDKPFAELAADELNVREIIVAEDIRAFTDYRLKPQLRTLGPRYGRLLGKVSARLSQMDGAEALDAFDRGEDILFEIDGTRVSLSREDVLVETARKPGFISLEERGVTVALDTALTEELIDEGYARELISKLQTMRRDAGLEVTDRIHITYRSSPRLESVVEKSREMIGRYVLAQALSDESPPSDAYSREWDINGETALLSIRKA